MVENFLERFYRTGGIKLPVRFKEIIHIDDEKIKVTEGAHILYIQTQDENLKRKIIKLVEKYITENT
jgi:hypothetical protein